MHVFLLKSTFIARSLFPRTFCFSYIYLEGDHYDLTIALYIILFYRPLLFSGHSYFVLQLQVRVIGVCDVVFFSRIAHPSVSFHKDEDNHHIYASFCKVTSMVHCFQTTKFLSIQTPILSWYFNFSHLLQKFCLSSDGLVKSNLTNDVSYEDFDEAGLGQCHRFFYIPCC